MNGLIWVAGCCGALMAACLPVSAATYTVTTKDDSGPGSLRQAILQANVTSGQDVIEFNIPGTSFEIMLLSPLPTIDDSVIIDGSTQPGFAGLPLIELNGAAAGAGADGLHLSAADCQIRSLVINRFPGDGIQISGLGRARIEGCIIGLDTTALVERGNGLNGIFITASSNNRVGGTNSAWRNIISGNLQHGVHINGSAATNNHVCGNIIGLSANGLILGNRGDGVRVNGPRSLIGGSAENEGNVISGNGGDGIELTAAGSGSRVQGNFLGLGLDGMTSRRNAGDGVFVNGSHTNLIGGAEAGAANFVGGNGVAGIELRTGASMNQVLGNRIGLALDGMTPLGNTFYGVAIIGNSHSNSIGGLSAGSGNIIAFNNTDGVLVLSGTNNSVRGNSLYSNGQLGIDLSENHVTPNDPGDADNGPNHLQNFPLLASVTNYASLLAIKGTLNTRPGAACYVDFYANAGCDSSGHGEGEVYLGSASVLTDEAGHAVFDALLSCPVEASFITATATDAHGNTSEFSPCLAVPEAVARSTLVVTTTNDAGPGSLRTALLTANNSAGLDRIHFHLAGPGRTIYVASPLPILADPILIDATTQPEYAGVPVVRLNGSAAPSGSGLVIEARRSTVRGLAIENFPGHGLEVRGPIAHVTLGGTNLGNRLAHNASNGVAVALARRVSMLGNSIFANGSLAIDLAAPGVNANDPRDTDAGANEGQNYPALHLAYGNGAQTVVEGMLHSTANSAFLLEFFSNTACDSSGHGEGQSFLGRTHVVTDPQGNASFLVSLAGSAPFGSRLTATATDANGNTSEFSPCQRLVPADSVDLIVGQTGPQTDTPEHEWQAVSSGSNLVYVVSVTNAGPAAASGVVLLDTIPAGVAFLSAVPSQGSCGPPFHGIVRCNLGNVPKGGHALVTLTFDPMDHGIVSNAVAASSNEPDNVPANNASVVTTWVGLSEPGLRVQPSGTRFTAGELILYTVTLNNAGPDPARQVLLEADLGSAYQVVSARASQGSCEISGVLVQCSLPSLGSASVIISGRALAAGTLTSAFSLRSVEFDRNETNNSAVLQTEIVAGPGLLRFEASPHHARESAGSAWLSIHRQGGAVGTVSVSVLTASGTADAGADFTGLSQTLTFTNGESAKAVAIPVLDDTAGECNETFTVLLTNATGGAVILEPAALVTIFDNDLLPEGNLRSMSKGGTDASEQTVVSGDGCWVAYTSYADGVGASDANGSADVLLYHRLARSNILVSANSAGSGSGNGFSGFPSLSADGRYVAFQSDASDLAPGDGNDASDVFVRDTLSGTTTLVSARPNGLAGNGPSYSPVMSADGRYVAFVSLATDLSLASDQNGAEDIFLRDLSQNTTVVVSLNRSGDGTANDDSFAPRLALAGSGAVYICFISDATDLVAVADDNETVDVFLRDVASGVTHLISATASGARTGNGASAEHDVTATAAGQVFVAFTSEASDLVPNDANGHTDIFLRDLAAARTALLSGTAEGGSANGPSALPSLSRDARYVAFESSASDLAPGDHNNAEDIFVRDVIQQTTALLTRECNRLEAANGGSFAPRLSADGRYVVYSSVAANLVSGEFSGGWENLFRQDRLTGENTLISKNIAQGGGGQGHSFAPALSASSDVIAFESGAEDLVADDSNGVKDTFLWTTSIPRLNITAGGSNLTLRWPADTPAHALESSTNGAVWWPVTNIVASNDHQRVVTVPREIRERARFYRLRR